jgi:hypothetical protein
MKRFAELDNTNTVTRVVTARQKKWLTDNLGGRWVETYTDGTRVHRAGIGFTYDEERDAFIPPKPFDSWVLDKDTCLWEAPVPKPEGDYEWDEATTSWVEVPSETV